MTDKEVAKKLKLAFEWLKKDMIIRANDVSLVRKRWIPHIEDVLRLIKEKK